MECVGVLSWYWCIVVQSQKLKEKNGDLEQKTKGLEESNTALADETGFLRAQVDGLQTKVRPFT